MQQCNSCTCILFKFAAPEELGRYIETQQLSPFSQLLRRTAAELVHAINAVRNAIAARRGRHAGAVTARHVIGLTGGPRCPAAAADGSASNPATRTAPYRLPSDTYAPYRPPQARTLSYSATYASPQAKLFLMNRYASKHIEYEKIGLKAHTYASTHVEQAAQQNTKISECVCKMKPSKLCTPSHLWIIYERTAKSDTDIR